MIYHPSIIILASVFALILSYKKERIFGLIALSMPVITLWLFWPLPQDNIIRIFNLTLIYKLDNSNKLIGLAFILVLFAANLYALGQKKKNEIIFGSSYAASAFFCLAAGDFLSLFVGLELMMIFSSILIFIGGSRSSLRSANKYFITHLLSSNLIIIGISYLTTKNNSLELIAITNLLNNPSYLSLPLLLMTTGFLINIAIFPFCGWMVNYYPKASPSGFLYLISFTTKVSVMLLIKLFAGYEPLKYIAIIMMLYASIKALYEDNMLGLLCYLSIISMGLMLLAISHGSKEAIIATTSYLFIHIIYKSLLSISFASIIDKTGIYDCSNLKKINSTILLTGLIIGLLTLINTPLAPSFYIKSSISHIFSGSYIYLVILFLNFMTIIALPWKEYFSSTEYFNFKLNIHTKISILFMTTSLISIIFIKDNLPLLSEIKEFETIKILSTDSLKQTIIIICALFFAMRWKTKRKDTNPINIIETICNLLFYIYSHWLSKTSKKTKEPLAVESLESQIKHKIISIHDQKTAIFIVVLAFMAMLLVLNASI